MQDICFALTTLLSIQSKTHKVLQLYDQVESILKLGKGKKGYLALAACVFIIIRQDKVPLTIADVYKCITQDYGPIHYKDLGKMFTVIVSSLKLQLPLSDFFNYLEKCIHSLPIQDRQKFIKRSQSVAEFGKLCGLETGRSKSSICVAIVLLVLEAESGLKPSQELIVNTSDLLSISKRQVMSRRHEFVSRLVEYGRQWPCFDDLDSKNFSVLLGALIDWGTDKEWKSDLSFNPPAFKKSIANSAETLNHISIVKRAIDEQNIASLSSKDLVIAEYIQSGHSTQEIVDYNPIFGKKRKKR